MFKKGARTLELIRKLPDVNSGLKDDSVQGVGGGGDKTTRGTGNSGCGTTNRSTLQKVRKKGDRNS